MTLLQQLSLVGLFPAAFVALAVATARAKGLRPAVKRPWLLALLTAGVWSSAIASHYLAAGLALSAAIPYTWQVIGYHALSLLPLWLLWTTLTYTATAPATRRTALVLSALLWLAALALDPAIWRYDFPPVTILGRQLRFFDIWGGLWVGAWLMPLAIAWDASARAFRRLPASLYRNQLHYWWLALTLFVAGGALALARQTEQVPWQEAGALFMLAGAGAGLIALGRSRAPDLYLFLRRALRQLSGAAVLFVLVGALLWLVRREPLGRSLTQDVGGIVVAAGLFTFVYLLLRRLLQGLADSALLPEPRLKRMTSELQRSRLEPEAVGHLILALANRYLGSGERWLFTAESGVGGQLVLRPLTYQGSLRPETAVFASNSPFALHLKERERPLIYQDIGALTAFDALPAGERAVLSHWGREAFLPLRHDDQLVGVLALGGREDNFAYRSGDLARLAALGKELAGPLHEALRLMALRRITNRLFEDGELLLREKQVLEQENALQSHFIALISPRLRRPLKQIDSAWQALETRLAAAEPAAVEGEALPAGRPQRRSFPAPPEEELGAAIQELRTLIDHLITLAGRVDRLGPLQWESLYLDDLCRKVISGLTPMAEARRVIINYSGRSRVPPVTGDAERLMEAIRHLLHNAVKFSKIGGEVTVNCSEQGADLCLEIVDSGVGIPEDRLAHIWSGFGDATTRATGGGLGLGLPLARAIILAHGGRIAVTSKHGAGATVTLHLPLTLDG